MNTSTTDRNRKGDARPQPFGILSLASGLRCKPGDLAIVTGKDAFDENLGCIVEVISAAYISDMHGFMWNIRSVGRPMKIVNPDTQRASFAEAGVGPDSCLTPINGISLDDAEEEIIGQEDLISEEVH